jgi:hypothetical protein
MPLLKEVFFFTESRGFCPYHGCICISIGSPNDFTDFTEGDWNKAFFGLWDGAVDDFAAEEVGWEMSRRFVMFVEIKKR